METGYGSRLSNRHGNAMQPIIDEVVAIVRVKCEGWSSAVGVTAAILILAALIITIRRQFPAAATLVDLHFF